MTHTTTAAKNPNAAQISRCLNKAGLTKRASGESSGYVVATVKDSGKVLNHTTGMPTSLRFPIVQVKWEDATPLEMLRSLVDPQGELEQAEQALTGAGYHIERLHVRGCPTLVALPQELIDWRAERKDRAERAEEIAEQMIPAVAEVYVRQHTFPSHERRSTTISRAQAVENLIKNLTKAAVDVMDADEVAAEARRQDIHNDGRLIGIRCQGSTLLYCPLA